MFDTKTMKFPDMEATGKSKVGTSSTSSPNLAGGKTILSLFDDFPYEYVVIRQSRLFR